MKKMLVLYCEGLWGVPLERPLVLYSIETSSESSCLCVELWVYGSLCAWPSWWSKLV